MNQESCRTVRNTDISKSIKRISGSTGKILKCEDAFESESIGPLFLMNGERSFVLLMRYVI